VAGGNESRDSLHESRQLTTKLKLLAADCEMLVIRSEAAVQQSREILAWSRSSHSPLARHPERDALLAGHDPVTTGTLPGKRSPH